MTFREVVYFLSDESLTDARQPCLPLVSIFIELLKQIAG